MTLRRTLRSSAAPLLRRLWTHPSAIVLDRKDVTVEGRNPLLTLHRHLKVAQSVRDISLNLAPKELRIPIHHIRGTRIAKPLVNAVFHKFVVGRVQLAQVERISKLADKIT